MRWGRKRGRYGGTKRLKRKGKRKGRGTGETRENEPLGKARRGMEKGKS